MTGDKNSGADFKARLKDLGTTQKHFAKVAGVDAITVNRWARGVSEVPGPVRLLLDAIELLPMKKRREILDL